MSAPLGPHGDHEDLPEDAECPAWEDGKHCYIAQYVRSSFEPAGLLGMSTVEYGSECAAQGGEVRAKRCACGTSVDRVKT